MWIERSVQVLTRAKGSATPAQVEVLMAKRLALDDALTKIMREYGADSADVTHDLPMFLRDRQETVFI